MIITNVPIDIDSKIVIRQTILFNKTGRPIEPDKWFDGFISIQIKNGFNLVFINEGVSPRDAFIWCSPHRTKYHKKPLQEVPYVGVLPTDTIIECYDSDDRNDPSFYITSSEGFEIIHKGG